MNINLSNAHENLNDLETVKDYRNLKWIGKKERNSYIWHFYSSEGDNREMMFQYFGENIRHEIALFNVFFWNIKISFSNYQWIFSDIIMHIMQIAWLLKIIAPKIPKGKVYQDRIFLPENIWMLFPLVPFVLSQTIEEVEFAPGKSGLTAFGKHVPESECLVSRSRHDRFAIWRHGLNFK